MRQASGLGSGRRALCATLVWVVLSAQLHAADPDSTAPFGEAMNDQRVFLHGVFDELEGRFGDDAASTFRWDGEAWVGSDSHRLWFKSEGFAAGGRVGDGDQELLYAQPVSTYFDLQAGVRYDLDSSAGRGWAAVGVEGLAPYDIELSATVYASDAGHYAAKLVLSHEELLTQRLILQPRVELNAYTRADPARGIDSGLSDLDAGVRLRYEISRKFAPYMGLVYERGAGQDVFRAAEPTAHRNDWRFTLGLRAWL